MKIIAMLFLAGAAIAADFVVYEQATGRIVSYDKTYEIPANRITADGLAFTTILGTNRCQIISTTNAPAGLTNIVQLADKTYLGVSNYRYSIRTTPEWVTLTNSIAVANVSIGEYAPLKTNLAASVAAVTDAKSKAALLDAKAIINQLQAEVLALQDEVRALRKVVGKNVMLCEP